MRPIKQIIVHCSDTTDGNAAAIRKYHIEHNHWHDIGYHFVIDRSGNVENGRPEAEEGAHCEGHNIDSLGVCLVGVDNFTTAQWDALKFLLLDLMKEHGLTPDEVHCHYEFDTAIAQGKTCPNIPVEDIRALIKGEIS